VQAKDLDEALAIIEAPEGAEADLGRPARQRRRRLPELVRAACAGHA
jgi:hypothetical protein